MALHTQETSSARAANESATLLPSWLVGICGVAAVASALFTILLFLNR
jgi:hypothetical protein